MFSESSSGMVISKASSNSITSSTMSRESAPRSLMKLLSEVTVSALTLSLSTTISTTFALISDTILSPKKPAG
jgi:hypothetical protein